MQVLLKTWAASASLTRELTGSSVYQKSAVVTGFLYLDICDAFILSWPNGWAPAVA